MPPHQNLLLSVTTSVDDSARVGCEARSLFGIVSRVGDAFVVAGDVDKLAATYSMNRNELLLIRI